MQLEKGLFDKLMYKEKCQVEVQKWFCLCCSVNKSIARKQCSLLVLMLQEVVGNTEASPQAGCICFPEAGKQTIQYEA